MRAGSRLGWKVVRRAAAGPSTPPTTWLPVPTLLFLGDFERRPLYHKSAVMRRFNDPLWISYFGL